jgi:hypothetical protein
MNELAYNDFNDTNLYPSKLQNQVNRVRQHLSHDVSVDAYNTKSELSASSYTFVNSGPGISSLDVVEAIQNVNVNRWYNPNEWIKDRNEYFVPIDFQASTATLHNLSVSEWVAFIRFSLVYMPESGKLADRINLLVKDDEYNEGVKINTQSLSNFAMFLSTNKIVKKPSVSMNSNGYIDALWRSEEGLLVEIIFHPGDESQIVTFSSDLINYEVINKRVATLPIKSIMGIIKGRRLNNLLY